jgi:hypothetical protein
MSIEEKIEKVLDARKNPDESYESLFADLDLLGRLDQRAMGRIIAVLLDELIVKK